MCATIKPRAVTRHPREAGGRRDSQRAPHLWGSLKFDTEKRQLTNPAGRGQEEGALEPMGGGRGAEPCTHEMFQKYEQTSEWEGEKSRQRCVGEGNARNGGSKRLT